MLSRFGSGTWSPNMIVDKTVKYTKTNQVMAFLTLEDLLGTVEVVIFPRDYERYQRYLQDDAKIFVIGHATVEDEQNGKIICEKIIPFDELPKQLWLIYWFSAAFLGTLSAVLTAWGIRAIYRKIVK
jgi:hypothetical protein